MNKPFRHLILTRFNVLIPGHEPKGLDWLEHRFEVFERFCLPSVQSQTNQDFHWMVFFHADTPRAFLERIEEYRKWKVLRPIFFRSVFSQSMVRAAISDLVEGYSHLITTRLDNDDAICRTFIETIQQRFRGQDFEFLNFTNGYVWNDGKLYSAQHPTNAFISLVENVKDYSTVHCGNHMDLGRMGPILQLAASPAWLQVVHGRNLLNQAWGTPCPIDASGLGDDFGIQMTVPPLHPIGS